MEEGSVINDICRLCLTSTDKDEPLLLSKVTVAQQTKFQELTQTELVMTDRVPFKICADCSEMLENFHSYRLQLIRKQELLQMILADNNDVAEETESDIIEEEYLEEYEAISTQEEEETEIIEVIALPSVRNLPNTSDSDAIIKLIDEIEEKNQIILDCSNPPERTKRRKISKTDLKKSSTQVSSNSPVVRNEELKFEKQVPKLIMRPTAADEALDAPGIVLYSFEKQCSKCGQGFSSDFKLQRHQLSSHPLENSKTCCDEVFENQAHFKKHQQSVHPRTVMCPLCGKMLKNKKTFLVHKRSHQTITERKFKCSYPRCAKAFNFKLHLDNHERTHSGERPFKCHRCPSSFRQTHQLTVHIRKHDGKITNNCSKCNLRFNMRSQLSNHEQSCSINTFGKKSNARDIS